MVVFKLDEKILFNFPGIFIYLFIFFHFYSSLNE